MAQGTVLYMVMTSKRFQSQSADSEQVHHISKCMKAATPACTSERVTILEAAYLRLLEVLHVYH